MNIAVVSPYGEAYSRDRLFDPTACNIGENLLLPGIKLKESLEEKGHQYHTVDMYDFKDIDVIVFHDINNESRITGLSPIDKVKYILKKKWKRDYLAKLVYSNCRPRAILIAQEPPVIFSHSYNRKFHELFDEVLTWDDGIVSMGGKYHKFQYPQVVPEKKFEIPFDEKKLITLISSNKKSNEMNELYSKRYEFIQFMESNDYEFDLYGVGWQTEGFKCYRGRVDKKLETLSRYKFSLCYENMCGVKGYITEKIFDCFFAGTVPIYWGAENIADYIPTGSFIDRRNFASIDELYNYIITVDQNEYKKFVREAKYFLSREAFMKEFSIESYIARMEKVIFQDTIGKD